MPTATRGSAPSIVTIGFEPGVVQMRGAKYFSNDTLKGYDLIILNTKDLLRSEGWSKIEPHGIEIVSKGLQDRFSEIVKEVERGTALVILPGDSTQVIDNYVSLIPVHRQMLNEAVGTLNFGFETRPERGDRFQASSDAFAQFLHELTGAVRLEHHVRVLMRERAIAGLVIPRTEDVVGAATRVEQGGGIVLLLPHAIPGPKPFSTFCHAAWNLVRGLRANWPESKGDEPLPGWAGDYVMPGEIEIEREIDGINSKIEEMRATRTALQGNLAERQKLKRLFASYNTSLEDAVEDVIARLGFRVERPLAANRTDRIAWDGHRAILLEITGVTKSASAKKLGQLFRWKGEFYEEHQRDPDALLLIANGWRELPLDKRESKPVFEPSIITDADRNGIGLITATQLLCLYLDLEARALTKEEARMRLLGCKGMFTGGNAIPKRSQP